MASVLLVFAGIHIGATQGTSSFSFAAEVPSSPDYITADLSEFWQTWALINEAYPFEQPTDEEKVEAAIAGLVSSLDDPYSVFFTPTEAEDFNEEIRGTITGIGVEIDLIEDVVTVITPLKGTPAAKANIQSGDKIVAVDGVTTKGLSTAETASLIKGEQGTTVILGILRDGSAIDIPVIRDIITIPTVTTRVVEDTFIIELFVFSEQAADRMIEALDEFAASGADNIILDIRGNPGGLLNQAIDIASMFLPEGKLVVQEYRGDDIDNSDHRTSRVARRLNSKVPLVILLDRGSASASEILAGALSEHGRATIIGSPSFGKGSVQQLFEIGDAAALKLTISEWLTPDGISISKHGLTPSLNVEDILEKELETDGFIDYSKYFEEDASLDYALRFLDGEVSIDE